jgi:hypothetical protein
MVRRWGAAVFVGVVVAASSGAARAAPPLEPVQGARDLFESAR